MLKSAKTTRRGPKKCAFQVLECIDKIERMCAMDPAFENEYLYDAMLRNLQVMSESTRYIYKELRCENPDVAWKGIRRLRNVLAHGYLL